MTENEIKEICKKYKIKNYTINSDMTVDVNGDVILFDKYLTELPLKFGKVDGWFDCSANLLTTLKGCPTYVGENFSCQYNKLTTLKGCPNYIGDDFFCFENKLTTLYYMPNFIGDKIICSDNHFKIRLCISDLKTAILHHPDHYWKF